MYDLNKIIVIADYEPEDKEELLTLVMHTEGMKIIDLLYINNTGFLASENTDDGKVVSNKKSIKKELKSELYDDMYDDDLNIKVKESFIGEDALNKVAKFIDKIWTEDCLVYYYDSTDSNLKYLRKALEKRNGKIYIGDYCQDIFTDSDMTKDIKTIMKEQGLNTSNMLKDSTVSFMYFLHGLVEKMINR